MKCGHGVLTQRGRLLHRQGDLLYGLLRSAHDAELLFNPSTTVASKKLASEVFKEHMANTLAATSRQTRELLGYVASRATPPHKPRSTHSTPYSTDWRFIMATPRLLGRQHRLGAGAPQLRTATIPAALLRLNVMFDNSIPDGQGGYRTRRLLVQCWWWHQDAQRFAELFAKGMRVKVEGRAIIDRWPDKSQGKKSRR